MPETLMTQRVLVVEDEDALRSATATHLRANGFETHPAATLAEARTVLETASIDAVVLDHHLPDGEAFDLLPTIFDRSPRPVVVLVTAHGTIDLAVRLVKEGVQQFLGKPVDLGTLVSELRQHLGQRAAVAKRAQPPRAVSGTQQRAVAAPFFGPSEGSQRLREQVTRHRDGVAPILVVGEVGTGKGILARYLHTMSSRGQGPFVEVGCASVSRELLEAELFGSDRGGLLEAAHGGTIFLDDIGELDLATQSKLLDVLETKRLRRIGDPTDRTVDVRIIGATSRDLSAAARSGSFREDLHQRLAAATVTVPPLRERAPDIVPLARLFLGSLAGMLRRANATLTPEAEAVLLAHTWPGNVRELKNCLERALVLGDGGIIQATDVQFEGGADVLSFPSLVPRSSRVPARSLEDVEIEHIRTVLSEVGGRVDAAAVELQMPRSTLYERIRRYAIDLSEFRRRKQS